MFSVKGQTLGQHMAVNRDFTLKIEKEGDSDDVKQVKRLLTTMLASDPNARPSIDKVVGRLRDMRDAIGLRSVCVEHIIWLPTKNCGETSFSSNYV